MLTGDSAQEQATCGNKSHLPVGTPAFSWNGSFKQSISGSRIDNVNVRAVSEWSCLPCYVKELDFATGTLCPQSLRFTWF